VNKQLSLFPPEPVRITVSLTTYIYIRPDGKCVHVNAGGGFVGQEYEHDDPAWQPPADWPYEIFDMRKEG
jgi:hypothetical protein